MIGTFPVCTVSTRVLFNTGATHSFVSPYFVMQFVGQPTCLENPLCVSTPLDTSVEISTIYLSCGFLIGQRELLATLYVMDMLDFDVIPGMDWMSEHYATIDCRSKTVTFRLSKSEKLFSEETVW